MEDIQNRIIIHCIETKKLIPVRLALEIYERCLQYSNKRKDIVLYDCCCGGAYMLTILGLLKSNTISKIYGSDIHLKSIKLASDNLGLLSERGIIKRRGELEALYNNHRKATFPLSLIL